MNSVFKVEFISLIFSSNNKKKINVGSQAIGLIKSRLTVLVIEVHGTNPKHLRCEQRKFK